MTPDGLITLPSEFSVPETAERFTHAAQARNLQIFTRIDHGAGAQAAGLPLRPTLLLIFGNPKGGTPLMQMNPVTGIDLPMKALVWEDAAGKAWLTYNDAAWLQARHALDAAAQPIIDTMAAGMAMIAKEATQP